MDTKDSTIEKTEQVIKALDYAHANNLDINNTDDVKKILKAIDIDNSNQDIEEFKKLIQAANTLFEQDVERRQKIN